MPDHIDYYSLDDYLRVIDYITMRYTAVQDWDEIIAMGNSHAIESFSRFNNWPAGVEYYWNDVVSQVRNNIERTNSIRIINNGEEEKEIFPKYSPKSSWIHYKKLLIDKGFNNIQTIESECTKILRYLRPVTEPETPVKGMVVGYVQSGKTANMAGVISMAADYGWNFFIVLSGIIDNLRIQTSRRLTNDLAFDGRPWITIDHINITNPNIKKITEGTKYLNVCLKNSKRLDDVLEWLNQDLNRKKQLKILLIDDEADQASINTKSKMDDDEYLERSTINDVIVKIVQCYDKNGITNGRYGCLNYLSYTATPYANFLNEVHQESLYPRDFIIQLEPSKEYFGPYVIFGRNDEEGYKAEYSGLDIVVIDDNADHLAQSLSFGHQIELPEGLKDAIAWFIISACILQSRNYHKPVSMLVNVTQNTEPHKKLADAIQNYLIDEKYELIIRCKNVFYREISRLPLSKFHTQFPDYTLNNEIEDYPIFSEIEPYILNMIMRDPKPLMIDDQKKIDYSENIHICIDNSKKYSIDRCHDYGMKTMPRIIYPDDEEVDFMTSFIIIGGNTLSRGLTLKGLVSTYFGRVSPQGDTFMQMGRWFGYRRGYELLPRIWMSSKCEMAFKNLVDVDESLRMFIDEYYDMYAPFDIAPKIRKFPKTSYLKRPTATNKSKAARKADFDFTGCRIETTSFSKDLSILSNNLVVTKNLIRTLKSRRFNESEITSSLVCRNVPKYEIVSYLSALKFDENIRNYIEIQELRSWIATKEDYYNWNVILGSSSNTQYGNWDIAPDLPIFKVGRAANISTKNEIWLGSTISNPRDRYADARLRDYKNRRKFKELDNHVFAVNEIRRSCGMDHVPLLIIYCISKDSEPRNNTKRTILNVDEDLIAISIQLPGLKTERDTSRSLQVPEKRLRRYYPYIQSESKNEDQYNNQC